MNTRIDYMYRDADNYKQHEWLIVSGAPTQELTDRLEETLDDGEYFLPGRVGLTPLQSMMIDAPNFGESGADHVWHELTGISETESEPTRQLTFEELVLAFEKAVEGGWDVVAEFESLAY